MTNVIRPGLAALAGIALLSGILGAQVISEFAAPVEPVLPPAPMIQGPDGLLYFSGGRTTTDGESSRYGPSPQSCGTAPTGGATLASAPSTLTFAGNASLNLTMNCVKLVPFPIYPPLVRAFIGRVAPSGLEGTTVDANPTDLVSSPDGSLWIASGGIGLVRPDLSVQWSSDPDRLSANALAITQDGTVWFTGGTTVLGKLSNDALVSIVSEPGSSGSYVAIGPDGNFWVTGSRFVGTGFQNWIARCTPTGQTTKYMVGAPTPIPSLGRIVAGPDGNLWFTEPGSFYAPGSRVGRVTTEGVVTEFATPSSNSRPGGIVAGPDGNVWFTEIGTQRIGRVNLGLIGSCIQQPTTLCLNGQRFQVTADWQAPDGTSGHAGAVSLTDESGYFTFFDPSNVEVVVKILDGCSANGWWWGFASGLTNIQVTVSAVDTTNGHSRSYMNPGGQPFPPIQDVRLFACP